VIDFAAESHPGNRYQHNEDSLGWSEDAGVWLVADGMGGHACGDVASRIAKQSVLQSLGADDYSVDRPLVQLISEAHNAVVAEGVRRSAENMGSTIVMVRLNGARAQVGWCGDSRVYLWRNSELVRLTRDHSLLEQLLESGVVEPAEAFGHPQKHVLVQALGITNPPPVPAQLDIELANEDMLLLCSDGLHDELRDEDISLQLLSHPEPSTAVAALIAKVLEGPARDNISLVCLRLTGLDEALVTQPPLSVPQLRERFERLPGRRAVPMTTTAVSSGGGNESMQATVTPPATPTATPLPTPEASAVAKAKTAPARSKFDRDLLIAIGAVGALVVLLLWVS